jgi:LysM repeat protein
MPQPLIITLLLFAFVLPILGAVVLRLLGPRLAPVQLYGAAVLLLGVVITSVLVLARSDIPSLQIGNLSILLPVTAPDDSFLSLVPTTSVDQQPAPATLATSAPVTATVLPLDTATAVSPTAAATQTATAEPTAAPTAVPTATPEPTTVPPTAIPPTVAPAPAAAQRKYIVQPGDTLLAIAKKFNTTVTAIVKANKLTPQQADALRVGQELVIP